MTLTRSRPPPARLRRGRDERGASLVEYAMMMALIAIVCVTAISFFGSGNAGSVDSSADSIVTAG